MGSLSGSVADRFCPGLVLFLVDFESAIRAVLEFIADEKVGGGCEEQNERWVLLVLKGFVLGED